ncbi:hypothetical protein AOLI_G00330820 [Acnodon oligacanthus]
MLDIALHHPQIPTDYLRDHLLRTCRVYIGVDQSISSSWVEPGWQRVVQVDLEMDVTVDMVGSGSISWMVEYPGIRAGSEETETQIHVVQKELAGVIPLAMADSPEQRAGHKRPDMKLWDTMKTAVLILPGFNRCAGIASPKLHGEQCCYRSICV